MEGEDHVAAGQIANAQADLVDLTDGAVAVAEGIRERPRTEGLIDVELGRKLTPVGEQLGPSAHPRKDRADTNFVVAHRPEFCGSQLDLSRPDEPEGVVHAWKMTRTGTD